MLTTKIKNFIKQHASQEKPNECCGLVVKQGSSFNSYKCRNDAPNPKVNFSINPIDYLKCSTRGQIVATYHSHNKNNYFSLLDKESSYNHKINYIMYNVQSDSFQEYDYKQNKIFYLNKPFKVGKNDCFTLVRNYLKENLSIDLPESVTSAYEKGAKKNDLQQAIDSIEEVSLNYDEKHFFRITTKDINELRKNDIIVLGIKSKPFPLGIYLGDNLFIHHPRNKYITTEHINEKFFKRLLYVYRSKK